MGLPGCEPFQDRTTGEPQRIKSMPDWHVELGIARNTGVGMYRHVVVAGQTIEQWGIAASLVVDAAIGVSIAGKPS